ncbi:MAG: signal recognition particle protein [Planctomycetota bacterium]|nr:MAG: signal recognition particle protein [Planctomycetota bacterium]
MFETLTQRLTNSFGFLRGKKELTEDNVEEGLREVRSALLEADVHFKVAQDFTERVKLRALGAGRISGVDASQQFIHAFHQELVELMGPEDAQLSYAKSGPTVILLAGLQGAGKTTTCAKLALYLREKHQRRPLLVAADVKRPAAVEQLRVLGSQIGVPVFHLEGASPPEVCRAGVAEARATGADVVLLDTAGRLHVDDEMMAEIAEIARVTQPHDQVLVVDAMTGQDAVNSARVFHERLTLTGVILTKLDGDARGGAALALKEVTGAPILFVGVGEKTTDLDAFHAERMAGRILGMGDVVGLVEKAQEEISETEAQQSFEKLVMGSFTLEDMVAQLRMIRRLGPMKKVLGMLPGMGKMAEAVNVDDKQMNRLDALFTSMTARERLQPDLLDMSRRRRIARGAGQEVSAVNELLKRFKDMKKMMKQMNKLGLGAMMGGKAKREALAGLSPTGELADPRAGGGGGLLGGLGSLFGGGGGGLADGPGGSLGAGLGGGVAGARPMGSSATRKSGKQRKQKQKQKRKQRKRK